MQETLVNLMFTTHGKRITDENLALIKSWAFPLTKALSTVCDNMYDAFVHVVITEKDLSERYVCYMLERHGEYNALQNDDEDYDYLVKVEYIQELIMNSFESICSFLNAYLFEVNTLEYSTHEFFDRAILETDACQEFAYGDNLLRAIWIDKLMEMRNANES